MNLHTRIGDLTRTVEEFFQDQWFDRTRGVRTSGNVSLLSAGIPNVDQRDSEIYQPARPAHIREALHAIPVQDPSAYTYIDLGSGKGRTLFVASEFSFRHIIGVEFSRTLHLQACRNIAGFRRSNGRSIQSVCQDAAEFPFPDHPLVLYMFNPFGVVTMRRVLDNLERSLRQAPRHAVIVLLWPRCGELVAGIPGVQLASQNRYIQIFANAPEA